MAVPFDLFGLFPVELRQFAVSRAFGTKQLIKLCMNSLGIAVFGTLNEQSRYPGCEGRDTLPPRLAISRRCFC